MFLCVSYENFSNLKLRKKYYIPKKECMEDSFFFKALKKIKVIQV